MLNANGDPARFADYGLPVVPDTVPDFAGPLAGVLAGLDWAAAHHPQAHYIVTVPADGPFVPRDLVQRLAKRRHRTTMPNWRPRPAACRPIRWSASGRCAATGVARRRW